MSVPRDDRVPGLAIERADAATPRAHLTVPLAAFVGASFRDAWLASKLGRDLTAAAARVAR
jgi:hypothetical protein